MPVDRHRPQTFRSGNDQATWLAAGESLYHACGWNVPLPLPRRTLTLLVASSLAVAGPQEVLGAIKKLVDDATPLG